MRLRLVCVGFGLMALPLSGATAAETFDAGTPIGSPVVSGVGVAWGASDGLGSRLLVRDLSGTTRVVTEVKGSSDPEGFYGTRRAIAARAAAGGRFGYSVSTYDNAESKYSGGDGLVAASVSAITIGGAAQELASCGYGLGVPTIGVGDGFAIVGGCFPQPFSSAPDNVPTVSIDRAAVGTGRDVQAAGPFAAWDDGTQVLVRQPSTGSTVGGIPRGPVWALGSDGSITAARGFVLVRSPVEGGGRLEVTPLGGTTTPVATEPGGVFGLRAGGTAVVYETSTGPGERTVIVRRGGERLEVGRLWALNQDGPDGFATDGTRVAFLSPRCAGGADLTVATIGEPPVDRRVAPCAVTILDTGSLTRRRLTASVACDAVIPPSTCAGTATVRARGRVLARGAFRSSQPNFNSAPLKLTAAGRRVVGRLAKGRKLRARVQVTRDAGTAHPTSSARVTFSR